LKNIADVGLVLSANTVYTNGQTNTTFYIYGNKYPQFISPSAAIYAYSTNQIGIQSSGTIGGTGYTNITAYGTNLGLLNPFAAQQTGTNAYFLIGTNGFTGTGGSVTPSLFSGAVTWSSDSLGQFNNNGAFTFSADADDNRQTGALSIKLVKSYDGLIYDTNNIQTVSFNLNGTNMAATNWFPVLTQITTSGTAQPGTNVITTTNTVAPSWLNGARYVKIWSVTTPTNSPSGTNVFFFAAGVSQFTP
jgi:hypothetical protein